MTGSRVLIELVVVLGTAAAITGSRRHLPPSRFVRAMRSR
jgi:hypothetical protein